MNHPTRATAKIVRATIVGGFGRAINALAALVILALLSRHLQLDELGRFALWGFLLTLLDQVTDFGTGTLTLQRGAQDDWAFTSYLAGARRVRTRAFLLGWLIAAVCVIAFEGHDRGWILLALFSPCTRRFEASVLVLQRRVAWEIPVAIRSTAAVLRAGGVAWLVSRGVATAGPFLAWIAATQSLAHVALHLAARSELPRPTVGVALPRHLVRSALPLALVGLAQLLHVQLDHVFVRALAGEEELARYHVAARVFSYLVWVPVLATQAALPVLARARADGTLGLRLERYRLPTAFGGALFLGALWPFADVLLTRAFGIPFATSAPILRALLVAAVIQWSQAWWVTGLVAADRARGLLIATTLALTVNALANAWLVPRYGAVGAGWSTAASELVVGLIAFGLLWRSDLARLRALGFALLTGVVFLGSSFAVSLLRG